MRIQETIVTLNDLFAALFRPAEGESPVIRQPQRPLREELFELFFPDALVAQFAGKSKSNLTWFFTSDARNKSVRRALVALLRQDAGGTASQAHRKCRRVLWPAPGQAAFDGAALRRVLLGVRLPAASEGRLRITRPGDGGAPSRVEVFYDVDEAAALSRLILTLAVAGDAPGDALAELWRGEGDIDFMRGDDTLAGAMRYSRMLDLQGRRERAFEGYRRVADCLGRPAQTMDESTLYCRLGEMLFIGEGCLRDEKSAQAYDRLGCLDENPRSWYQLANHITGSPAREAMERAAELGYGPALRQLGMAWYNGSARLACLRNTENARRWFQRGMTVPGEDGAACAFMLGQLHEALNERDAAVNAYRIAQEAGSAEAAERLSRLDWALAPAAPQAAGTRPAGLGAGGCCLVNGLEGCNRRFIEGLEGRWSVTVCGARPGEELPRGAKPGDAAPEAALRALSQGVYWGGAAQFPPLVIALLSEDRQRNLRQAATLLGELQRMAQSLGDRAWDLVDAAELYVLADRESGGLLLDAALAGMGEMYFRVRLCDPALDAADRLFFAAPLFLPRLKQAADAPVRLKLIGGGDVALAALRRAMALPLPEAAEFSIDVYAPGAGALERRFYQLCPGMPEAEPLCAPLPRFHECDPRCDLLAALSEADGLASGNYFVVAAGEDALNLRLGALLRGELMKREPEAERPPFIAVYTADPVTQWLAGSLPAGPAGETGPARWYNQYDLYPFGALDMYAPRRLSEDPLERRAQQAHMLFVGLPNTRDARHSAMRSYYRRQFNRDTARLTALGLAYRLHLAGIDLPGWRLYGQPGEEARLGAAYTRWLKEEDHLQAAVRDEHRRRSRVKLSLGWASATAEQVAAYVRRGNPGHIVYPAWLDPFICPWEALEDGGLLKALRDAVRARTPERSVPDPRRDEEASVRDTEAMMGV